MNMIASSVDDSRSRMAAKLRAELARPGHAVDAYFYRSPLVYETELTELVFRSWIYAGHVSEVANPGDYLTLEIGEDSLIIVRDDDGEIRALMNICRHRGARVCEGASGNRKTFVCPYHGWVYRTDGSLKAAREMHMLEGFDATAHGLRQARVVVYMGLIFINCDTDAQDLLAPLQNLDRQLGAYDLPHAKVAHKQTYRIAANWKLVLENYLECYHCATSHRSYSRMHTLKEADHEVADRAMLERTEVVTGVAGMGARYERTYADAEGFGCCVYTSRYGLYDGFLTGSKDGQPVAPLMGQIQDYDGGVGDFQIGPLTFMLNYPDHCVLYRFIPRDVGSTDMEVVWFVRGDAVEGVDYDREKLTWLWHHTTLEDEYIITRNSHGVNSRFFEPGPYHPVFENELQAFMAWYLATLSKSL
ncbi:MAG: aromatic ring-hydroxylating dioxygenase subunit alpha [Gammaproteobacteria bacterium]|nr:aromatic ring-hydroxylating dioxygenase subunit alpha [Gammaproteobacteria bacterium]MDH5172911.1 aromatic ring-hydroxylating dioxygenase subunit alpha [Gammaproteobacteria bacterium]